MQVLGARRVGAAPGLMRAAMVIEFASAAPTVTRTFCASAPCHLAHSARSVSAPPAQSDMVLINKAVRRWAVRLHLKGALLHIRGVLWASAMAPNLLEPGWASKRSCTV